MAPPKGFIPWNKGKTGLLNEAVRNKISETLKRKGIKPPSRTGIPSSALQKQRASEVHTGNKWALGKGKEKDGVVSYNAYHQRVYRRFGKAKFCSNFLNCRKLGIAPMYYWANISGKYEDTNDYVQLCPSCNELYDAGKIAINV